ncbi:cytochrome P450 [Aspergillus recurvatus]
MTNLISEVNNGKVTREEMTAHASTLIIAGGETVATVLAATTYYLLKDRVSSGVWDKLCEEVRGRYQSYEHIDGASAQQIPYLRAVIEEGLRICPPGSQGTRISPSATIDGYWTPMVGDIHQRLHRHSRRKILSSAIQIRPRQMARSESPGRESSQSALFVGSAGLLRKNVAIMEINQILAKMIFKYDWGLVNTDLDRQAQSRVHVMWWKPSLMVRFYDRQR